MTQASHPLNDDTSSPWPGAIADRPVSQKATQCGNGPYDRISRRFIFEFQLLSLRHTTDSQGLAYRSQRKTFIA